jgi:hypothetical protein
MINHMVQSMDFSTVREGGISLEVLSPQSKLAVANLITAAEQAKAQSDGHLAALRAELAKKIGGEEIGFALTCAWDYGFCRGLNPEIKFTRTKTLMMGDDCCNHTYRLPKT